MRTTNEDAERRAAEIIKESSVVPVTEAPQPESAQHRSMQTQATMSFVIEDEYVPNANYSPFVSCKTYVIMDTKKGKLLQHKNADEVREMASLTKMMTAIVTLELVKELNLDLYRTHFKVSEKAATTVGTTAYVISGQMMTIIDLLYGLMLPSGNDAAMTLAENFHRILSEKKGGNPRQ